MPPFHKIDWTILDAKAVVNYGNFPVATFDLESGSTFESRFKTAQRIVRCLNDEGGDARHRLGWVYFGALPLTAFREALQRADVDWKAFKSAFNWRLVYEDTDPERPHATKGR